MSYFRSEAHLDNWLTQKNLQRGEVLTLKQVWTLSKLWYGNRLGIDYTGRTAEEAHQIFEQAGLTSSFWRMAA